jgi:beta-lactam-binding protein with PASTA domain
MPMGVVIIAIVAVFFGTMSGVFKIWLNRPGRSAIPQAEVKQIRDGLMQLQDAVDAIAIEVERLSEGQRFTTKLLADQAKKTAELIRTE